MPELALNHVERDSLACHFDGVCVAELVRCEPPAHPRLCSEASQLRARAGLWPRPPASWALDDAERRSDRQLEPHGDPRREVLPTPVVDPNLAPPATLPTAHEQRTRARVEVALVKIERLLDPQPGAPEHYDQPANPRAARVVPRGAHDRHDLLNPRRIRWIAHPLVPRGPPSVELVERRRNAADQPRRT